jgi:subtilisin family serine protease
MASMKNRVVWALVIGWTGLAAPAPAERIAGRYIVELTAEPVASHVMRQPGRGRDRMNSAAAWAQRARIRGEQDQMRQRLAARNATVRDGVDTVANALFVEMSEAEAAKLAGEPGVKRVTPERTFKMVLDRAVALHRVTEAWDMIGADRAGEGIKIAIIDSGVDASHPGFQNSGLSVPDGFPMVNYAIDAGNTNEKVIVARSYVGLLRYRDPDYTSRDHVGHGTALAMIAAGVRNDGPLASIEGVAPRAWLGNYKIFGTPGYNDNATDSAILKAMDDAVADGMDIINLSLGDDFAPRLADDVDVDAVERATAAGVIVVVAAGNNGPGMNTISSPATAPSALAVGATSNSRTFGTTVSVEGMGSYLSYAGSGPAPGGPVQAELADVEKIDGNGQACSALGAGSLSGKAALILRGGCTFETKLTNAQQAGAVAAVVYAAADSPNPITMSVGSATLPAMMVSNPDGLALKQGIANGTAAATLDFALHAADQPGKRVTDFTAVGPGVDLAVKPDLVATGENMYTATQGLDPYGDMFNPSGYTLVDGTSFSVPLVAGAAALLKSARPGLTVSDYRSLLVNTAAAVTQTWKGEEATLQQTGGGLLDVAAALQSTVTAYPVSLSFGAGGVSIDAAKTLKLTNRGADAESFQITVKPKHGDTAPAAEVETVEIAAGATVEVGLKWTAGSMTSGPQDGVVEVQGLTSGTVARVPYWYDASTGEPASITLMSQTSSARRGAWLRDAIYIRVTDAAGAPLADVPVEVEAVSGGGAFTTLTNYDGDVPGIFGVSVYMGMQPGTNVFRIRAGQASLDVAISGT